MAEGDIDGLEGKEGERVREGVGSLWRMVWGEKGQVMEGLNNNRGESWREFKDTNR